MNFKGIIHKKFLEKLLKDWHSKVSLGALYGPLIPCTLPAPVHRKVMNVFEVTVHLKSYGPRQKLAFNLLAPELFFWIVAHPVYKIWIIQEPNTLQLWNKLHYEEKKNGEYIPCLKYSVPIFVE